MSDSNILSAEVSEKYFAPIERPRKKPRDSSPKAAEHQMKETIEENAQVMGLSLEDLSARNLAFFFKDTLLNGKFFKISLASRLYLQQANILIKSRKRNTRWLLTPYGRRLLGEFEE